MDDSIESRARTIIAVGLGIVGRPIHAADMLSAEAFGPEDYAEVVRMGEDWRGDARQHERRMRNRTHGRVIRSKVRR